MASGDACGASRTSTAAQARTTQTHTRTCAACLEKNKECASRATWWTTGWCLSCSLSSLVGDLLFLETTLGVDEQVTDLLGCDSDAFEQSGSTILVLTFLHVCLLDLEFVGTSRFITNVLQRSVPDGVLFGRKALVSQGAVGVPALGTHACVHGRKLVGTRWRQWCASLLMASLPLALWIQFHTLST